MHGSLGMVMRNLVSPRQREGKVSGWLTDKLRLAYDHSNLLVTYMCLFRCVLFTYMFHLCAIWDKTIICHIKHKQCYTIHTADYALSPA
jgi:hypothetical protein